MLSFKYEHFEVHNIIHGLANEKAVTYALTSANTPLRPYQNEHALLLWFDEYGKGVEKAEEMIDGIFMKESMLKLEKDLAKHGAKIKNRLA